MIETKDKTINIKDMTIEDPSRRNRFTFDPKKELTRDHRIMLEIALDDDARKLENRFFGSEFQFAQRIMYYHVIFPDRLQEVIDNGRWVNMKNTLEDIVQGDKVVDTLSIMKLASPDRMVDEATISDRRWTDILQRFDEYVKLPSQMDGLYGAIRMARALKVWGHVDRLALSDKTLDAMYDSTIVSWPGMSHRDPGAILADFRIVDEKRFQKYKSEQPLEFEKLWNRLNAELRDKENSIFKRDIADIVGSLAILGTDEIKVTDQGLQLLHHEPLPQETSNPVPERRKF